MRYRNMDTEDVISHIADEVVDGLDALRSKIRDLEDDKEDLEDEVRELKAENDELYAHQNPIEVHTLWDEQKVEILSKIFNQMCVFEIMELEKTLNLK